MNLEQDRDGILLGNRLLICEAEIGYCGMAHQECCEEVHRGNNTMRSEESSFLCLYLELPAASSIDFSAS